MCGLCGLAGNIFSGDRTIFEELLTCSAVRGKDATGVAAINRRSPKGGRIRKQKYDPMYWINNEYGKDQILSLHADAYIGHTRSATVGDMNSANAHPFDTGRYISAHNGTLVDAGIRALAYERNVTDSLVMFELMEKEGVEPVLEALSGSSAFAITMYDKKEKCLIFARNKERSLHVAVHEKKDIIYWASESKMLEWILSRNGVDFDKVMFFEPGKVYRVPLNDIKAGKMPWDITEIKLQEKILNIQENVWTDTAWSDWVERKKEEKKKSSVVLPSSVLDNTEIPEFLKKGGLTCYDCGHPILSGFRCHECIMEDGIGLRARI